MSDQRNLSALTARKVIDRLDEVRAELSDMLLTTADPAVREILDETKDALALAADQIEAYL